MSLFSAIRTAFRRRKDTPAGSPVVPSPPPVTGARVERDLRNHLGSRGGCFGTSRGQKFDRLCRPLGLQDRGPGLPPFMLYNLKRDIPGHPAGSTVSRETVEQVIRHLELGGKL